MDETTAAVEDDLTDVSGQSSDNLLPLVELEAVALAQPGFTRYEEVGEILGKGGMGEVRLVRDRPIGRRVAMKVMRERLSSKPGAQARFLREARVQGQLEHPCIVPVYEVGLTPEGDPYFTMKRVRGTTLRTILGRLRQHDPETELAYSRRKLLTAFSTVCLAIDAAHRAGVLHRDIKPENLMLGKFGEVYVLDWGVASLADHPDEPTSIEDVESGDLSRAGSVFGTPTYMAPEQAAGHPEIRSDVYSLGAVLYEILTLRSLHDDEELQSTPTVPLRPSAPVLRRADDPDLPPELLAICLRATSSTVGARHASARELHENVERFLDGDRDLDLRHRLAGDAAERAATTAARALGGTGSMAERIDALRDAGRALSLEPDNTRAVEVMLQLLATPPAVMPAEAAAELDATTRHTVHRSLRITRNLFLIPLALLPLVLVVGVKSWPGVIVIGASFLVVIASCSYLHARPNLATMRSLLLNMTLVCTALATLSYAFGMFMVVPTMIIIVAAGCTVYFPFANRTWLGVIGSAAILAPFVLEWVGILSPSYRFVDAGILIIPRMIEHPEMPFVPVLIAILVIQCWVSLYFFGWYRDQLGRSEHLLHLQSWQLRQLLPSAARPRE